MRYNVLEYLEKSAVRVPEKVAFAYDKKEITYGNLIKRAKSIGYALSRHAGGALRKPIVVFVDRNIESLVSFMGVAYSGNFYVPIDIQMPI